MFADQNLGRLRYGSPSASPVTSTEFWHRYGGGDQACDQRHRLVNSSTFRRTPIFGSAAGPSRTKKNSRPAGDGNGRDQRRPRWLSFLPQSRARRCGDLLQRQQHPYVPLQREPRFSAAFCRRRWTVHDQPTSKVRLTSLTAKSTSRQIAEITAAWLSPVNRPACRSPSRVSRCPPSEEVRARLTAAALGLLGDMSPGPIWPAQVAPP